MKCISSIKETITNSEWTFILLSDAAYIRREGKASEATCYFEKKVVYFKKSTFTPKTVTHELLHCLVSEYNLTSADLTNLQFEEIMCELVANNICQISLWTNNIFHKLLTKGAL